MTRGVWALGFAVVLALHISMPTAARARDGAAAQNVGVQSLIQRLKAAPATKAEPAVTERDFVDALQAVGLTTAEADAL